MACLHKMGGCQTLNPKLKDLLSALGHTLAVLLCTEGRPCFKETHGMLL